MAPPDINNPDSQTNSSHSKLQTNRRSQEQTGHRPRAIQSDETQKAVVVEPREPPRGDYSASQVERDHRLGKLERSMGELVHLLDILRNKVEIVLSVRVLMENNTMKHHRMCWDSFAYFITE